MRTPLDIIIAQRELQEPSGECGLRPGLRMTGTHSEEERSNPRSPDVGHRMFDSSWNG
jgi:hypothetical protein